LGKISDEILHFIRNFFIKNEIRLLKRNYEKIFKKHNEIFYLIENKENFKLVLN